MAQERLVLDEDRHGLFRIFWYLPDEDDLGACLGDYLLPQQPCEDAEHRIATESAKALNTGELDTDGLYWYTRSAASKALAAAKAALDDSSIGKALAGVGQASLGSRVESAEGVEAVSWVKCSDRQPTGDFKCWVVKKTKTVLICRFNPNCWCWDDEDGDDFAFDVNEISHWQPYLVPAPPKE